MSRVYDSWERLVAAVLDKEKLRQLALSESFDSSRSSFASSSSHEYVFATRASREVISQKVLSGPSILPNHDVRPIEFEEVKKSSQNFGDLIWSGVSSLVMSPAFKRFLGSPQKVPPSPSRFSMSPKLSRLESVHLNMDQVVNATNNFSSSLRIGEGGFGTVYKAQLSSGQVVAIKRARKEDLEALHTEFRSEVELLAKTDHRNLVKLLGYVVKGNKLLIITEYVSNGTLREHLDGIKGKILDFNQRLEISIDVAHVLTYLHLYAEKQIIHRDVKSSNILLTESLRAKVADFGFARLGDDSEKTHVVTKVKGTPGYLDPEYKRTFQLTTKSNVYSFGILLLEILTGRRPVEMKRHPDERVTIKWAFRKYIEGRIGEMVDPLMGKRIDKEILVKMFGLAIQCAAPTRADRPDMKAVSEQLWGIRMDYLKSQP